MTIQEIKKRKKELSIKIEEEIRLFEKETGKEVIGLSLNVSVVKTALGEVWARKPSVDISLKKPYEDEDS